MKSWNSFLAIYVANIDQEVDLARHISEFFSMCNGHLWVMIYGFTILDMCAWGITLLLY